LFEGLEDLIDDDFFKEKQSNIPKNKSVPGLITNQNPFKEQNMTEELKKEMRARDEDVKAMLEL
jgi:hypothetical protein